MEKDKGGKGKWKMIDWIKYHNNAFFLFWFNCAMRSLGSTIKGFLEKWTTAPLTLLVKSLWQIHHYYSERMEKWRTKSMWIVNLYFRGNQEKIRMRIWINNEQIIQQDFCLYQSIVRNPCNTITNFQINLCSNTREIGNKVQSNYDSKNYEKCFFFGVVRGYNSFFPKKTSFSPKKALGEPSAAPPREKGAPPREKGASGALGGP